MFLARQNRHPLQRAVDKDTWFSFMYQASFADSRTSALFRRLSFPCSPLPLGDLASIMIAKDHRVPCGTRGETTR